MNTLQHVTSLTLRWIKDSRRPVPPRKRVFEAVPHGGPTTYQIRAETLAGAIRTANVLFNTPDQLRIREVV